MIKSESRQINWRSPGVKRVKDRIVRGTGYAVFAILLLILGSIVEYISGGAIFHLSWRIIATQGTFEGGGIYGAIVGTWMLVGLGLAMTIPPGILGPLYLIRRDSNSRIVSVLRLFTDILTSVPSIVVGVFGYLVMVLYLGWGYSLVAGSFALAVMMLPYIIRVTELSLKAIPREQVQNAYALGANDMQVASRIYLPQAMSGILSGVFLAISIAAGETAQLLYTANFGNYLPSGISHSYVGYLSGVIYFGLTTYSFSPGATAKAFVAAFILIVMLLVLILLSKNSDRIVRAVSKFNKFLKVEGEKNGVKKDE